MNHSSPSREELERILRSARTIAVVGASSKPGRPSNRIFRYLKNAGYIVLPVNPNETDVDGSRAYPSLEAIDERVDLVDVFRRSDQTPEVAKSAAAIGARTLWLQLGVVNDEAGRIAEEAGMAVVMDQCIAVVHAELGLGDANKARPSE